MYESRFFVFSMQTTVWNWPKILYVKHEIILGEKKNFSCSVRKLTGLAGVVNRACSFTADYKTAYSTRTNYNAHTAPLG